MASYSTKYSTLKVILFPPPANPSPDILRPYDVHKACRVPLKHTCMIESLNTCENLFVSMNVSKHVSIYVSTLFRKGTREHAATPHGRIHLKGTVSRDFSRPVFFIKLLLLVPVDKLGNDFDNFRIVVELFDYFGTSPVLTTPVKSIVLLKLDGPFQY
jgi:hypothetical protein